METTEITIQEENEQKKEYLKSYRRAIKREQDILDEIQRLRLDKMFPSVANDGMPHGSSYSDLSDYAAILNEQIDLLKEDRLEKVRCYQKIEKQISQMENEDEKEVQTETLTVKARPLASGYVKAKTGDSTTEAVYNDWYKSVYQPAAEVAVAKTTSTTTTSTSSTASK